MIIMRGHKRQIRENAWTNSTSSVGCKYINPHTSPIYLIAADCVLYIEVLHFVVLSVFVTI